MVMQMLCARYRQQYHLSQPCADRTSCLAPNQLLAYSVHAACNTFVSHVIQAHVRTLLSVCCHPGQVPCCLCTPQNKVHIFLSCALQARAVGDELVVGLVPDREILRCKGPPVQNQQERKIMVEAVKWVGQVIEGTYCGFFVAL